MPNISEIYESKYLSAADLNGKEPVVTITQVTIEAMQDGQRKLCLFLNNRPKGFVLNKTNAQSIAGMYGQNSDAWVGRKIKLISVWTDFQGKTVQALRAVQPPLEDHQAPPPAPPPVTSPDDFGARLNDDIPF